MPAEASSLPLPYVDASTIAHTLRRSGMPVAMPGAQRVRRSAGNTVNATSAASVPSLLDESGLETVAPKGIEFLQPNIKMAARRFSDFLEERAISFVGRGGWRRMLVGLGCPPWTYT